MSLLLDWTAYSHTFFGWSKLLDNFLSSDITVCDTKTFAWLQLMLTVAGQPVRMQYVYNEQDRSNHRPEASYRVVRAWTRVRLSLVFVKSL